MSKSKIHLGVRAKDSNEIILSQSTRTQPYFKLFKVQSILLFLSFLLLLISVGFLNNIVLSGSFNRAAAPSSNTVKGENEARKSFGQLPIYFVPNEGLLNDEVKFFARGAGYSFYLTKGGVTYAFIREKKDTNAVNPKSEPAPMEGYALKLNFAGSNPEAAIDASDKLGGKLNYMRGDDSADWKTGVPTYGSVTYKDLYQGIDLTYKGDGKKIKYEFVASPGSDPGAIRMNYRGADKLTLDDSGNLIISTPWGDLKDEKPVFYQTIAGQKKKIDGSFRIIDSSNVGFTAGGYNKNYPLIIDPGLAYSTFLGGAAERDVASGVAVDSAGSAYVTGFTGSNDFPTTPGAFGFFKNDSSNDVFVTKLNSAGTALVYSTFILGNLEDVANDIKIDSLGNAYITGYTNSFNYPGTTNSFGEFDSFVTKINANGSALPFSKRIGGSGFDYSNAVQVDRNGLIYIAGYTDSRNGVPDPQASPPFVPFPTTTGAHDRIINTDGQISGEPLPRYDAFITKIDPVSNTILYSTYVGGNRADVANDIDVNRDGDVYITGYTKSGGFPTTANAFDVTHDNNVDAFLTIIRPNGQGFENGSPSPDLRYSTFLGGTQSAFEDLGGAISVDASGRAYIAGSTEANDFPTTLNAFDRNINNFPGFGTDAFFSVINPAGNLQADLIYSTYLGGSGYDQAFDIEVDTAGTAYIAGSTGSQDFPTTPGGFDGTWNNSNDAFVSIITPSGGGLNDLLDSTYLGGTNVDILTGMDVDLRRNVYVAGETYSGNFPTVAGSYDTSINGISSDAFVTKFNTLGDPFAGDMSDLIILDIIPSNNNPDMNQQISVDIRVKNQGLANSGPFDVDLHDNPSPEPPAAGQVGAQYQPVTDLAPGQETTVTFNVSWPSGGPHKLYGSVDTMLNVIESNETNNIFGPENVIVGKSDLLFESFSASNLNPDINETVTVNLVIGNRGDTDAGAFDVDLYDNPVPDPPQPGQPGDQTKNVAGLAVGATTTVSFDINWPANGSHKLIAQADTNGAVPENDELNNLSSSATVNVLSLPDLIVEQIEPSNFVPSSGELVNVKVTVKNQGSAAAGSFNLDLYDNPSPEPPTAGQPGVKTQAIAGLASGATTTVNFSISWALGGPHKLYALADRGGTVTESKENNNAGGPVTLNVDSNVNSILAWDSGGPNTWDWGASKTTSGDFNGDGRADIAVLYGYATQREVKLFVFKGNANGFDLPQEWWASGPGNWDWAGSMLTSGDYTGDGRDDIGVLYGYASQRDVRAFVFPSVFNPIKGKDEFSASQIWFHAGPNNWDWAGSKLTTGDFDGDGKDDFGVLYGYAVQRDVRIFIFLSNGNSFGKNPPFISEEWFHSGPGNWDWAGSMITAGDYNGDGKDDFGVLYGYAVQRDVRAFVFPSTGTKFSSSQIWFHAGPNNWDWAGSKLLSGEFTGDTADEMVVFYGYAGARSTIFIFPSNQVLFTSSVIWYDSGPGNFAWDAAKPHSGNFDGVGTDEIAAFYNYGNSYSGLFIFK